MPAATRRPASTPAQPLSRALVLTAVAALTLGACSSGSGSGSGSGTKSSPAASPTPSASPSASSTVKVPAGASLTPQGSRLSFGDAGTVIYEPTQNRGTVLQLTVTSVRKGRLSDFKGFILDSRKERRAAYYYARVQVKNVGEGDVGGVPVPLYGVNKANTLLPPVNFISTFPACPTRTLPGSFASGDTLSTCLVYLSPGKSPVTAVSYRPNQAYNPITWTGTIKPPAPLPKKKKG